MSASGIAEILKSEVLARVGVPHGFSTRLGGVSGPPFDSLNFGNPSELPPERRDPSANIAENWRRVLAATGCPGRCVAEVHQVHGGEVRVERTQGRRSGSDPKADAIVTDDAECVAAVRVADCAPVLLASSDGRVVAAVHAGWRGVIAGVAGNAARAMRAIGAGQIVAAIGPCIGPEHFEVGEEVANAFRDAFGPSAPVRTIPGGRSHIDLQLALETQLREVGAREVDILRRCTFAESQSFFSHRRDRGLTGRMVGLIGPVEHPTQTGPV